MIPTKDVFDKEIITRLQACDPVVAEYRIFFRPIGLGPGAGTG